MESLTLKPLIGAIVVDPTVLNTRERLTAFLGSMIYRKYLAFLPSLVSSSIQLGEWDELVSLLREWEWNLDRSKSEEWFKSSDFKRLSRRLKEVCVSFEETKEELSREERDLLLKVLDIIRYDSPRVVELARELITAAITKKGAIISYTRHPKKWLKKLRRVLIFEISEKTDMLSEVKAEIKKRLRNSGWKGGIFVTLLNMATGLALTSVLPLGLHWVLASILSDLGEDVIIGVMINGR